MYQVCTHGTHVAPHAKLCDTLSSGEISRKKKIKFPSLLTSPAKTSLRFPRCRQAELLQLLQQIGRFVDTS